MVTLDDILADQIITKVEQNNLASKLLSLDEDNSINNIKEIGSNMALDVASAMQGTNAFSLSRQITDDKENASLISDPVSTQKAKLRHETTMRICDRIASPDVAMIVMRQLKSKFRSSQ